MRQFLLFIALTVAVIESIGADKCNVKDEKLIKEVEKIGEFAEKKCNAETGQKLTQNDLDKLAECYDKHVSPMMTGDNLKLINDYVHQSIIKRADILTICDSEDAKKKMTATIKQEASDKFASKVQGMKKDFEKMECDDVHKNFHEMETCTGVKVNGVN